MRPIALTIAGSDPSGGAGIQADLKTFFRHGVIGTSVITLLTVQNTVGVRRVETMAPDLVTEQLDAVLEDVPPAAMKTGALGSAPIVRAVAERIRGLEIPLVIDPVMISKHGAPLLDRAAEDALRTTLLPLATLITPNAHEAGALLGRTVRTHEDARTAARDLGERGIRGVLVKGGHLEGDPIDVLLWEGQLVSIEGPRVETSHTHGTGCTYAAAIVAGLSKGRPLVDAVREAKTWLTEALRTAEPMGRGIGPVNHFA